MLNGEKEVFAPILLSQGEHTRALLSGGWDHCFTCRWVLQTNGTGAFSPVLNAMAVVFCKELHAAGVSDMGLLASCPKDWQVKE